MSTTRGNLRTRVQRRMDASSGSRWDSTAGVTGEIDQIMGHVFRKEWKRILNACPTFRINIVQPTTSASGRIAFASLSVSSSADSGKNAYRIILVCRNYYTYPEVPLKEWAQAEFNGAASRVWWREGQNIMLLPQENSTAFTGTGDGFWVSWYPTSVESLSTDTVTVDFPDGYEEILALESAALLLTKGGAESDTSMQFKALAEEMRTDMLQDLARTSTKPTRMGYEDSNGVWASS